MPVILRYLLNKDKSQTFFFFLMLDQLKAKYLPPPSSRLGAEGLFFHGHWVYFCFLYDYYVKSTESVKKKH